MKISLNTILILFISLLFIPAAHAQYQNRDHSYRLKGGMALTNFSGEGFAGLNPGVQLGGSVKLGGTEDLFFQTELLFTMKGSETEAGDLSRNFTLFYMEIPLMFGLNVGRGFNLNAGFQPGVLIGGTMKSSQGGREERSSIGKEIAKFDYSLLLGMEYTLNEDWMVGVRYNNGFVPLQDLHGRLTRDNGGDLLHNQALQIYASYSIDKWFD